MRGKYLIAPIGLKDFVVVCTKRDGRIAEDFVETLAKVGPAMGIEVNRRCKIIALDNDRTDAFLRSIKDAVREKAIQMVREAEGGFVTVISFSCFVCRL